MHLLESHEQVVEMGTISKLLPSDLGQGMASSAHLWGMSPLNPFMLKPPQKIQN